MADTKPPHLFISSAWIDKSKCRRQVHTLQPVPDITSVLKSGWTNLKYAQIEPSKYEQHKINFWWSLMEPLGDIQGIMVGQSGLKIQRMDLWYSCKMLDINEFIIFLEFGRKKVYSLSLTPALKWMIPEVTVSAQRTFGGAQGS